jgi:anti-sigma B factor antagonist
MERLQADVSYEPGRIELRLHGDLDLEGAEVLQALVAEYEHIERIDLSDVETIDSSGLFALVQADHRARLNGVRLTLVPPAETVARIFEWTGLDARLTFLATA